MLTLHTFHTFRTFPTASSRSRPTMPSARPAAPEPASTASAPTWIVRGLEAHAGAVLRSALAPPLPFVDGW